MSKGFLPGLILGVALGWSAHFVRQTTAQETAPVAPAPSLAKASDEKIAPADALKVAVKDSVKYSKPLPKANTATSRHISAIRWLEHAQDLSQKNQTEEALAAYRQAYTIEPSNREILRDYSNHLAVLRLWEEALPRLKECVETYPNEGLCHGNLANYYLINSMKDEAKETIDSCLKELPDNLMCLNNKGNYMLGQRKYAEAVGIFQRIKDLEEKGTFRFNQGFIEWHLGLALEGVEDVRAAATQFAVACRYGNRDACEKGDSLAR